MNKNNLIIVVILVYCQLLNSQPYKTFLIHGIASKANELFELEISLNNIGIKAISLELKNDPETSYTLNLDKQCEMYYETILNNINETITNLNKINLIGISQGGLIARCIVEKYNNDIISISNLITIASPNMGVYNSFNNYQILLKLNPTLLSKNIFTTIEEYWKDPFNYDKYLEQHKFITLLNNEVFHLNYNKYKSNIKSLDTFTAIWSSLDTVIIPKESSKFVFYNISIANKLKLLELNNFTETEWYNNDNLGIKFLDLNNKYESIMIPCIHNEFKLYKCFMNVKNEKNNTLFNIIKNKILT